MYQNGGGDTLNPMGSGTEQSNGYEEMGNLQFGTLEQRQQQATTTNPEKKISQIIMSQGKQLEPTSKLHLRNPPEICVDKMISQGQMTFGFVESMVSLANGSGSKKSERQSSHCKVRQQAVQFQSGQASAASSISKNKTNGGCKSLSNRYYYK